MPPTKWPVGFVGDFLRGVGVNGFHTAVRGTMFICNGAVTPGPSRECDITFFVKGRPKSTKQLRDSTVVARRAQSVTVPSSRVTRECRFLGIGPPPLKDARFCAWYHLRGTSWWRTREVTLRWFVELPYRKTNPNPNPNFSVRLSSGGVAVVHVQGMGAKKIGMCFETQENQTLLWGIPGFLPGCPICRGCPKSLRKKIYVQFSSPKRSRTRGAPFPLHTAPRMPKNLLEKDTWHQAQRHVCAKARLRNTDQIGSNSSRGSQA